MTESSAPSAGTERLTFDGKYIYQDDQPLLRIHPSGATPEFCAALVELWNRRSSPAGMEKQESGRLQAGDPMSGAEQGWAPTHTHHRTKKFYRVTGERLDVTGDEGVVVVEYDDSSGNKYVQGKDRFYGTIARHGYPEQPRFRPLNEAEGISTGGEPGLPKAASPGAVREAQLEVALRDLVEVCAHATFDNGVTAPDGRNEADYWASGALDAAISLLRAKQDGPLPEPNSATAHRLKFRIDHLLERAGSEEAAITGRGVGISYLFAKAIYRALSPPQGGAAGED